MSAWPIHVLTLYPDMFPGPLGLGVTGRALQSNLWSITAHNIRDFAFDKHGSVDDTPYGGGAGMVMRADVVGASIEYVKSQQKDTKLIYMSPRGTPLTQEKVKDLAKTDAGLTILSGRFEGIDQRVLDYYDAEEISIGDFVLSGGELPAMCLIDACLRYRPNVLGSNASLDEESFATGLLEYPHYTRPVEWKGLEVPEVLKTGHHKNIQQWQREQAEKITQKRRPDLWQNHKDKN